MSRDYTDRYPALALDTSSTVLDVVLRTREGTDRETLRAGRRHNELLAPMLRRLFDRNAVSPRDLSLVACSIGPGSFTGLRIGLSTAKGLYATARDCRLVGVPTLDAYARAAYRLDGNAGGTLPSPVLCAIDGRKHRYFAALYYDEKRIWGPADLPPGEIATRVRERCSGTVTVVGPDNERTVAAVGAAVEEIAGEVSGSPVTFEPSLVYEGGVANAVLDLAFSDTEGALDLRDDAGPVYLRGSQAEE